MQDISQIQLAAKARAGVLQKKISEGLEFWNPVKFYNFSASERLIGVDARLTKLIDTRWRRRQVPTPNLNSCPDRIPGSGLPPPTPTRPSSTDTRKRKILLLFRSRSRNLPPNFFIPKLSFSRNDAKAFRRRRRRWSFQGLWEKWFCCFRHFRPFFVTRRRFSPTSWVSSTFYSHVQCLLSSATLLRAQPMFLSPLISPSQDSAPFDFLLSSCLPFFFPTYESCLWSPKACSTLDCSMLTSNSFY